MKLRKINSILPQPQFFLSWGLFLFSCLISYLSGKEFLKQHKVEPIYPSSALTIQKKLSDFFPALRNSAGDTEVYIFEGKEPGGHIFITGGIHPNEPAGFITPIILIENIKVNQGKIVLIPRANASGFTHSDPQEGNPQHFFIETSKGKRFFRLGSRLTNPIHQWPDPTIYINPGGQKLSGSEVRNLNRCFPGRSKGFLTEKIAFGLMEVIRQEKIDLGIDVHESAPEYPVINAIVFHENSAELAALVAMNMEAYGFKLRLEASPPNLRGLSHREWGDSAGILAVLLETPNASHGRLKGKPSISLIVEGMDKFYPKASRSGRLFVNYPESGIPLKERVARHLAAIISLIESFNELFPQKKIRVENIPNPAELMIKGLGFYLHNPQ
ncbi:MAG: succinylglutamate desuccinylase/aspartoacylase family protein [Candidatus Aminicenantes bacterium]|nr:succinylglutamate desuccinylase/aspartoacylase family protein [Candidatus Aminicenantes bacterium]